MQTGKFKHFLDLTSTIQIFSVESDLDVCFLGKHGLMPCDCLSMLIAPWLLWRAQKTTVRGRYGALNHGLDVL